MIKLTSVIRFSLLLFSVFFISRLALVSWQYSRFTNNDVMPVFLGGLRVDLSAIAYVALVGFLLLLVAALLRCKPDITRVLFTTYASAVVTLVVLIEAATPAFILQYDVRPNRLFIEYLAYPHEVFSMLLNGHAVALLVSLLLAAFSAWFAYRYVGNGFEKSSYVKVKTARLYISYIAFFIVAVLLARGTLGHRPLNPSSVYFSQDALVNSLVLNSTYSVAFALKNMGQEKSAKNLYGKMDSKEVLTLVKNAAYRDKFVEGKLPTMSVNQPSFDRKNKNLVIILEESLGARFVGELGGKGLTPNLDKLYQQGWGFQNLYATGTRSVRGIEAVTTGFVPSPSRSVVKLSKSQHNFFTLADVLGKEGYNTQFIYGGESHFDNMKSFFLGNGFRSIVDFNDMDNPKFVSSWGASDEDLFEQANKELVKLHQAKQPFFSLIFTSSNHDPFDIPQGKVALPIGYQSDNLDRDLAIKYADYALGHFIDQAKQQAYWQDTIFMVVADHDVRVYGSEPVPFKSFHIPAVILNSPKGALHDQRLVSQLDLPVTLLSLLGIESATPMLGFDLTKQYPVERAMMQYYDNFAYLENDQAAILMPNNKVSYWHYDINNKEQRLIKDSPANKPLAKLALAHVLFSNLAYSEQWYRLADQRDVSGVN